MHTGRGTEEMTESLFVRTIVGDFPDMPQALARRLFVAFDADASGDVSMEDFIVRSQHFPTTPQPHLPNKCVTYAS